MEKRLGRPGFAVRLAIVAVLAASCDSDNQPPNSTMSANPGREFQELMARPDIEQVDQRYSEMTARIRDRIATETGLPTWKERPDSSARSSCRDYPEIDTADKQSRSLPRWASESNLPDDKWPQAIQIIAEIAGRYGFGSPQTLVDAPGRHEVSLKDTYGAEINFGTRASTSLQVLTGCHLTADAHKRGTPSTG